MCDFNASFSSYLLSFLIYKNMNLILWWCTAPNVDQWEFITFPAKQSINSTLVTSSFPLTLSTIWLFNLMPGNFLKGMLFPFHQSRNREFYNLTYDFPILCQSVYKPPNAASKFQSEQQLCDNVWVCLSVSQNLRLNIL